MVICSRSGIDALTGLRMPCVLLIRRLLKALLFCYEIFGMTVTNCFFVVRRRRLGSLGSAQKRWVRIFGSIILQTLRWFPNLVVLLNEINPLMVLPKLVYDVAWANNKVGIGVLTRDSEGFVLGGRMCYKDLGWDRSHMGRHVLGSRYEHFKNYHREWLCIE